MRKNVNGQVFPKILRPRSEGGLIDDDLPRKTFLPADMGAELEKIQRAVDGPRRYDALTKQFVHHLYTKGYKEVRSDRELAPLLDRSIEKAMNSLSETVHVKHASALEGAHGGVHVAVGLPMAQIAGAAYHPIFYLHHCNIDRLYEAYLQVDDDAQEEFQQNQRNRQRRNKINYYTQPLKPFKNPKTGTWFKCADTFDTKKLGYAMHEIVASHNCRIL